MTDSEQDNSTSDGYERKDVNVGKIVLVVAVCAGFLIVAIILLSDYFTAVTEEQKYEVVLRPESAQLRELRAHEDETLNTYKILDSAKGVYRIPIDRAMKVMADEAFQESQKK